MKFDAMKQALNHAIQSQPSAIPMGRINRVWGAEKVKLDSKEGGQIRLAEAVGDSPQVPVRLIRIVDMKQEIAFVWLVEEILSGARVRILEDDLGPILNEMEVLAWASR